MNLRQAIVFAILMENNEGIIGKPQSYIEEKLKSVEMMDEPENLLDVFNMGKFVEWQKKWGIKFESKK